MFFIVSSLLPTLHMDNTVQVAIRDCEMARCIRVVSNMNLPKFNSFINCVTNLNPNPTHLLSCHKLCYLFNKIFNLFYKNIFFCIFFLKFCSAIHIFVD